MCQSFYCTFSWYGNEGVVHYYLFPRIIIVNDLACEKHPVWHFSVEIWYTINRISERSPFFLLMVAFILPWMHIILLRLFIIGKTVQFYMFYGQSNVLQFKINQKCTAIFDIYYLEYFIIHLKIPFTNIENLFNSFYERTECGKYVILSQHKLIKIHLKWPLPNIFYQKKPKLILFKYARYYCK